MQKGCLLCMQTKPQVDNTEHSWPSRLVELYTTLQALIPDIFAGRESLEGSLTMTNARLYPMELQLTCGRHSTIISKQWSWLTALKVLHVRVALYE